MEQVIESLQGRIQELRKGVGLRAQSTSLYNGVCPQRGSKPLVKERISPLKLEPF